MDREKAFVISENIWTELFLLTKLSIPLCLTWIIEWIPNIVAVSYIGNLSNAHILLSSLGLSKTCWFMMFIILYGVTTSLFTLVPQAIGANKYELLPIYVQRCFYLVLIISIPLIIILYFGGEIMQSISNSNDVDYNRVSQDCKYFIITLYTYVILSILQKIPQSINLNYELLMCTIISLLFLYPSLYLFATYLNLGSSTYALNLATSVTITAIGTIAVYYKNDLLYVFKPVSLFKIFHLKGIKEYLYLAIPGTIIHVLEAISFEFATIYCSLIIHPDIAISSAAIINIIMVTNLFVSMAMSTALSVRIGMYVGANMIDKANECIKCGRILSFILSLVTLVILISIRQQIPIMYTNDEDIINLTANILYVTAISVIFFMGVYARYGIFRGIGKPQYPAVIVFGSYYLIPFPLMFVFLYVFHLKDDLLDGTLCIFITIAIGNFLAMTIMEIYLLFKLDWEDIMSDAQKRLSETEHFSYQKIRDSDDHYISDNNTA